MKISPKSTLLLIASSLAAPTHASIVATEYFNGYGMIEIVSDATTPLNGGSGWTAPWTNSGEVYLPGTSLAYSASGYNNSANLNGSGDGAMGYAGNLAGGSTVVREFTTTSSTVWFSALPAGNFSFPEPFHHHHCP